MKSRVAFIPEIQSIAVTDIRPSKLIDESALKSKKYSQILASIQEVGLIEPLSIVPIKGEPNCYLLLDGHYRLRAMREIGAEAVHCIVSIDDEAFTYNFRVNRLSPVQEHLMISAAIERGISVERISKALNVKDRYVEDRVKLLKGICDDAVKLLRYREFPVSVCSVLRKMKEQRQVECVELMIAANNLTLVYAEALLVGTPPEMLINPRKGGNPRRITADEIQKMRGELGKVQLWHRETEQQLGQHLLNFSFASRYIERVLESQVLSKFLQVKYPNIFRELSRVVKIEAAAPNGVEPLEHGAS